MRAPGFWWSSPGLAARLLQPASLLYGAIAARRMGRPGEPSPLSTVCVGNVTLGGAGKTPTAIHLAGLLRNMGRNVAFLSRGYGGRLAGPVTVDPERHAASDVGDEPLLLARYGRAIVARDRPAGARLAASLGADALVMDDGLQNASLAKKFALAVFDGAAGSGNGLTFPAGPLRAPMRAQWPAIDAVLVIGAGEPGERVAAEARSRGLPTFRGELRPDPVAAAALSGRRVLAFAGIGRPEKFFDTLRSVGANVAETAAFPDHHPYAVGEIAGLRDRAKAADLALVTTEKDAVRIAGGPEPLAGILTLPVALSLTEPDAFAQLLAERLPPG